MQITYIHHSGFLAETDRFYYLFDYASGQLPPMDPEKPVFVLSSHSHGDHYNPDIFPMLKNAGMHRVTAVLSDDIMPPDQVNTLVVSPGKEYELGPDQKLTTFRSTDLGVAFLLEDRGRILYHAGDLNDWVWAEETDAYNTQMTRDYQREIRHLADTLGNREMDVGFVVLDPRQEADYARGLCFFLEHIPVKTVYPMHYWENPGIMDTFLREYPMYAQKIQRTE